MSKLRHHPQPDPERQSIEQVVRDILTAAEECGLIDYDTQGFQSVSAGELTRPANVLASYLTACRREWGVDGS